MNSQKVQQGDKVRAGINICAATKLFWEKNDLASLGQLRGLYYDTVLDFGGVLTTYRKIMDYSGEGGYGSTLVFLLKALVDDLRAMASSIEKPRLEAIVKDIRLLKSLESIRDRCGVLVARLKLTTSSHVILEAVLALAETKEADAEEIHGLMSRSGVLEIQDRIYFVQQLKEILELVPIPLFPSLEQRERTRECVLGLLDDLVFDEEAEEGIS